MGRYYRSVGTQDGRVVLRRQFQVLVRKGMGLNPILDITSPLCGNTLEQCAVGISAELSPGNVKNSHICGMAAVSGEASAFWKRGNSLEEKDVDGSKDNRAIVDNNTAQSLTSEDIDEMQGAKGDEIVEALIANSATFEKKTLFSQEKYRVKKQKKYAPRVLLRRPFARRFMRVDALSLLLCLGNVTANADVLEVEMVGGILTGAIAERLGGTGYVCNTYRGSSPYPVDITRMFNLSDGICKRRSWCSVEDVGMDITPEKVPSPITKPAKSIKAGQKAPPEAIKLWNGNGFSSLIIAAPELDPWGIIKEVLPLLAFSAPFAVYHQYASPLATCMHSLQIEKMAIGLQISEPWLREYQVLLPSRTHPHMHMSAFSGTKISSSEPVTSSN
ncbi:putative tRNA (adenine(58)-N(1))-methyltransferase non-catalytic subunit trm6-like isoform X2 [Capsicum annuum]|nr:putative tRNA (adenine(58)-N(1))-methyltransferase non-catalytic subunit trm6-like isoform X2 [Capsicum annuum]